jgi:GNAT superfamily N-acetyltransferase
MQPAAMDPEDEMALLEQHADVLFAMDATGRLVGLDEPEAEKAPRLFLARGRTSVRIWLRADVPGAVSEACRALAAELPAWDGREPDPSLFEPLRAALSAETLATADRAATADAPTSDAPVPDETRGPAFRFGPRVDVPRVAEVRLIDAASAHLLERFFPYTRSVLAWRSPVAGVVVDGAVVSACYSARHRPLACEAGVATMERYRGRGFGALVVSAWRDAVERGGRQPLYSTTWDNGASRAIARRLGLVPYADTLTLTAG